MITSIPMLVIELVGFIAFLYITLRLLAVYRKLSTPEIALSSISFFFLSVSQLCAALSTISINIRVSTTLYVATATTAIAAFFIMIFQRYSGKTYLYAYIHLPTLVIVSPDVVAGILSTYVALYATRYTRILVLTLSISYYLRAVSAIVSIELTPLLLLVAELVRSISAVALAIYSSLKVLRL